MSCSPYRYGLFSFLSHVSICLLLLASALLTGVCDVGNSLSLWTSDRARKGVPGKGAACPKATNRMEPREHRMGLFFVGWGTVGMWIVLCMVYRRVKLIADHDSLGI